MDYKQIPGDEIIKKTMDNLKGHGMLSVLVDNKTQALEEIKKIIPKGSKVMNGSSITLEEIGYHNLLKQDHQWINLHDQILKENDMKKRFELRRKALAETDYFLSSVNAVTEDGLLVSVDATGSRVGAMPFVAKKLIFIISVNKIVKNLDAAFERIRTYVRPLEDVNMMNKFKIHTSFGKWIIIENEKNPERIQLILVKEPLGF